MPGRGFLMRSVRTTLRRPRDFSENLDPAVTRIARRRGTKGGERNWSDLMAANMPALHDIFNEAIARNSDEQRRGYLDEVCSNDPQVKTRIEALLRAHFEAGGFFGGPSSTTSPTELHPTEDEFGPYKLLEQIGEGGSGVVFMAEQLEPLRRKVALKILKPGMDTRQVIARFEAERQALAFMDHPNIAKVLDAGETPSGRPYFVLDL